MSLQEVRVHSVALLGADTSCGWPKRQPCSRKTKRARRGAVFVAGGKGPIPPAVAHRRPWGGFLPRDFTAP